MHLVVIFSFLVAVLGLTASAQSPSAQQMAAQFKQTIITLEKQIANAKKNPALAGKVQGLTEQLRSIKAALEAIEKTDESDAKNKAKANPGARWTGYLAAEKKAWADFPKHNRQAYIKLNFTDAIPTLHRDYNENEELNFTDDKGTGTIRETAEYLYGTELLKCDCAGAVGAELHEVVVNLFDSTYTIQADATLCDNGRGGCGMTYSISVADQPLTDSKILTGSLTRTNTIGTLSGSETINWYLVRDINAELIVTIDKYDDWMPEPGEDENTVGNELNIKLKLQGKNGKPLTHKAVRFELQLMQTSREPGITINFPKNPTANLPDLRFLPLANATVEDEGQRMKIKCDKCISGSATIGSYDGGGWTNLVAVAVLEDSTRIKGNLLAPGGPVEIPVPKRNPGSVIAEKWAKANGNPNDMDDNDKSGDNKNPGDGYTAYEEYRGVMTEGEYKRLNPKRKELGVQVKRSQLPLFSEGLDWFSAASDIDIVRFYLYEAKDRRVNFNVNHAHDYDQYALKLDKGSLPENVAGKAFTPSGKPDIPANTTQVIIAPNSIHQNYVNWSGFAQANNLRLLWTEKEYLAQTVAHEISHGVNVWHHGDAEGLPHQPAKKDGAPIFHIFDRNANEITARDFDVPADDRICPPHTQSSGNLSCIMAYVDVCDWVQINYADGSIGLFQSPLLPIGRNLCLQKTGTNINAGTHSVSGAAYENYSGKATNGECKSKIKLR